MKRLTITLCLLVLLFCPVSCLAEPVESLTYAVFPYLPNPARRLNDPAILKDLCTRRSFFAALFLHEKRADRRACSERKRIRG